MKIVYEKSGGFAGLRTRKAIDTAQLSAKEAAEVHRLIDSSGFFKLPSKIDQSQMRDAFQYVIEADNGSQQHRVSITGEPQEPSLALLRQKLESLSG